MKYLVEDKEKEIVFRFPRELDLCPILDKVGSGNEREENPNTALAEIRPRTEDQADINDQGMKKDPVNMLEFQGVKFVKLKQEIPDEVGQD